MKTINDLAPGERGIVREITTPDAIRQRLMDFGLIEGARIEMVRTAPLGDPVQIRVLDTLLAIRKNEAGQVFVEMMGERAHGGKANRHRFGWKSKQR